MFYFLLCLVPYEAGLFSKYWFDMCFMMHYLWLCSSFSKVNIILYMSLHKEVQNWLCYWSGFCIETKVNLLRNIFICLDLLQASQCLASLALSIPILFVAKANLRQFSFCLTSTSMCQCNLAQSGVIWASYVKPRRPRIA